MFYHLLSHLNCDRIHPIKCGKAAGLPFHSSREVEGPARRNLGNRSKRAGANSGRSDLLLEDERMALSDLPLISRGFFIANKANHERLYGT
jgi:hypothetical protein